MDNSSNGLGKLLPKAIAAKRRRNKASSIYSSASNDDVAPQKGPDNHNPDGPASETSALRRTDSQLSEENAELISLQADTPSASSCNLSSLVETSWRPFSEDPSYNYESLASGRGIGPGPLSAPDTRPTAISVHPSQIGHLTTSSPLVQEKYKPESQSSDVLSSEISKLSTRSATLPQDSSDSLDSAPSLRKSRTHSLLHPDSDPPKRSASGNRLRDVFRSKRGSDKSSSEEKTASEQPSPAPKTESQSKASPGRNRALSRGPKLEPLKAPPQTPQTPPHGEPAPPVIVNTPPTPTEPPLPVIVATNSSPRRSTNESPVGNMITQRRRAGSNAGPSKLSTITSAPLTPTPEAGPISPNPAATFFSSMFSAVQNTANSLSNTISTANLAPGTKSRAGTPAEETDKEQQQQQDGVEVESSSMPDLSSEAKEPAVKTLGMGDLSLSQLGIAETPSNAPSPVVPKFADSDGRNRSDSAPDPHPAVMDVADDSHLSRPRSSYSANGDRTPPAGSVYEGKSGVHRSGSIRSALGHRRKRGSSIATHNTSASAIGAAISAANSSLANPNAAGSTPKLTGFAVATKKRNRDFHTLFKSVPDDDYLIEDYSCALQREILAHGRLYISEGHLCFSSNILGWVTTLVMSFDEIVSVEKRSTALVFKNGLEISTLHAKHIFASFASRDTTYDLIIKIWKLGHPHLQSSLNGVRLEEPGGDRTEKVDAESVSVAGSQSNSGSDDESADEDDDDDDVYDEDEEEEDNQETSLPADATSEAPDKTGTRKVSGAAPVSADKVDEGAPASGGDFPGPSTHAPTECGDDATHYEKILGDETIPAPLGKVYNLLFGPGSAAWMGKFLAADQKCFDVQMEDKRGLTGEVKSRTFTYIKPLNGPIGPKQTKCIVTEQLESIDLEKSVNVLCSTQNPDVPSGNIFVVKTKYCLTWGENNGTRVQINCTIEWSGKSWLKGPIEKGANDGQTQYCKDLFAGLRAAISSKPRSSTLTNAAGARGKKRGRKAKSALASNQASDVESAAKVSVKEGWGLFEPARPFLGPVVDIISPILTGNVVYGLLVGLLVASWFGFGTRQGPAMYGRDIGFANYPQRLAAYEEMWSREESELWEWIEERAGLDRLNGGSMPVPKKRTVDPRTVEEKLREEKMDKRELDEAIRVTEEHLQVLKSVVIRKEKGESAASD
ncbi:hypothetical protein QBC40DRAFT_328757 [Triangularia verruculosa]|uniref:VASt domain-containing protein n=1 Tax=Triangularia verruculosa TaxID=2587418 RepID=A0AAN7AUA8_9PEZI|nr:hypothetical protein QBC40DRAFT_328757 [Triangularia verruculosa]